MDLFDLIFQGAEAFNQIIIFMVGSVIFIIGAMMIAGHFHTQAKTKKVKARICAVRAEKRSNDNDMYYPVVEYVDQQGNLIQAESMSGSSILHNKIPDTRLTVLIDPDKPNRFNHDGRVLLIIGAFLGLVGVGICIFSLKAFDFTPFSVLGGVLLLLWTGLKIKRNIKPRDQWEKPNEFMERKYADFLEKRERLTLLDKNDVKERLRKQAVQKRKWAPFFILIGLALCGGGGYFAVSLNDMLQNGIRAEGKVVEMKSDCDTEGCTYRPVVRFKDKNGKTKRFEDSIGSNPPSHKVGDDVTVLYLENGRKKPMIDRGIWNWVLPAGFVGCGLLIVIVLISQISRTRQRH